MKPIGNIFGFDCVTCEHNRKCYGGNMGNQFRYCQKSAEKIQNLDNLEKQNKQLQGKEWYKVKNSFRLLYTYKSDKGNIKGIYTDGKTKIVHWLNNEEKTDYLQSVKGENMKKKKEFKDEFELDIEFEIDKNNRVDMNQVIELVIAYNKLFRAYKQLKTQIGDISEELEEHSANAINKQVSRGVDLVNQQKEFIII